MKISMDLVSIIIPVYNTEKYIELTLKSILEQTYKNIEIIIVDDGSLDESIRIAEKILVGANFKIIHQKNAGLSSARNAGLAVAKGKYVCFIDSDDYINQNHIKWLVELSEKNKLNVVFSDFESTYENRREGNECRDELGEILDTEYVKQCFALRKIRIHACALLFKTKFLFDNKLAFNPELRFGEDAEFIWRMLFECKKIGHERNNTYKYLTRENSLMTSPAIDKALVFSQELKKTFNHLKTLNPDNEYFLNSVYNRIMLGLYRSYAAFSTDDVWSQLLGIFPTREIAKKLLRSEDWRVVVLSFILFINPQLFRMLTRASFAISKK